MSETQLQKMDDTSLIQYVPFGAADPIKLSVAIVQNIIAVKTKTGQTCSKNDAIKFIMLCRAQRLNPFAGDSYLVGYDKRDKSGHIVGSNFSLITAHQALLKRAETSSEYEGMESGIIIQDENGKIAEREGDFHLQDEVVVGGWAKVYRKGRKPTYKRLAIAQRKPKYDTEFWIGNKASEQIVKCSEADALRATFPTLLGGLYIEGEHVEKFVPESSTDRNGGFDAKGLVETSASPPARVSEPIDEGEGDLGPQPARTSSPTANEGGPETAVEELQALVLSEGYTFNHLQRIGMETGLVDGADSLSGFGDISETNAKRLLRAKAGLLMKLKDCKAKEVAA